jgi:hypothetical protein
VHSFCLELMPDFQPTSEVTYLFFPFDHTYLLPLTMILITPCRIQCLPLEPGQLFIMQYIQFLLWDLNPNFGSADGQVCHNGPNSLQRYC